MQHKFILTCKSSHFHIVHVNTTNLAVFTDCWIETRIDHISYIIYYVQFCITIIDLCLKNMAFINNKSMISIASRNPLYEYLFPIVCGQLYCTWYTWTNTHHLICYQLTFNIYWSSQLNCLMCTTSVAVNGRLGKYGLHGPRDYVAFWPPQAWMSNSYHESLSIDP